MRGQVQQLTARHEACKKELGASETVRARESSSNRAARHARSHTHTNIRKKPESFQKANTKPTVWNKTVPSSRRSCLGITSG